MNLILFKYILKHYVFIFFATLFALTAVVLLFDIIELLRMAAKRENIAFWDILVLGVLKSPQMIHIILPFVALLAGVIFFLKYSASSELIIMRSIGMSVWNFMTPIVAFVFLLGVFNITIFNPFAAMTSKQFERLEERIGMTSSHPFSWSENGLWLREADEKQTLVMRAGRVRQKGKDVILDRVSLFELLPNGTLKRQIEGNNAILLNGQLTLPNAFIINPITEEAFTKPVESIKTGFSLERILERFDEPRTMSFWRFPKFIHFLRESGFTIAEHAMYFNELLAYPIMLVAMLFIAAVFTLPPNTRQGKMLTRIVLAILGGFVLYFLGRVTNVLGLSQSLPYVLAAWGPSLVVIPLCITALLHLEDG